MKKITKSTKVIPTPTASVAAAKTATKKASVPRKLPPAATVASARRPVAPVATIITAHVDVGFGNTLYLRGSGSNLRWDKGVPLDCAGDDKWSITLVGPVKPFTFKLLLNDLTWSVGEDYTAEPGASITVVPLF